MERTVEYVQSMSNFDSIYNAPLNVISQTPPYIPLISVVPFSVLPNRPTSPIFRRCVSPPSRQPILPPPGPKFNFDLYKTNESINDCCDGRISPSYRSLSPTSSNVIHHRSTYSPLSSPSNTRTYLKLREINDDLYQTLAQTEFNDPSTSAPHYHIHHYPVSQHSYPTYRSRSVHDKYSSSTELEMSPKLHQARVTYRVHFPSEHHQKQSQSRKSSRHRSPSPSSSSSDLSSNEEPIIIDLYPTKDQGFIEKERIRSDHRSPWIVDGTALRRNSYTDSSTSRSYKISKGLYYGDKPIKTRRRSNHDKEQLSSHRSSSSKKHERVWRPPSKSTSDRPPKYFEPTLKSERDMPTRVRSAIDGIESDQVSQRKTSSNQPHIRTSDPKFKRRIENAESKVKTAWEPTVTGLSQSPVKESKPPTSHLIKQTTFVTPPKSHAKPVPSEPSTPVKKPITVPPQPSTTASTGRSSVNDLPIKPMFESTPRDQSIAEKNNESVEDLFQNESHISEPADRKHESHSSLPTLPEQPRKPSTELPKSPGTKPDAEPSSAVKDNVSITGDNHDENQLKTISPIPVNDSKRNDAQPVPSSPKAPTPERKPPSIKSDQKNDKTIEEDESDENDQEVARSFDINRWLNDASKAIFGTVQHGDTTPPSQPPPPPSTSKVKSPPRRKIEPPTPPRESPDHNLYKPPFGPKKTDKKPSTPPPAPPSTGETDDVDDFFS